MTYRLFASLLCLSVFIGATVPTGLHIMSVEHCSKMASSMHSSMDKMMNGEDCPLKKSEQDSKQEHPAMHDLGGIACSCSVSEAPLSTEVNIQFSGKTFVLFPTDIHEDHPPDLNAAFSKNRLSIQESNAYSPPPIYLFNEAFLN